MNASKELETPICFGIDHLIFSLIKLYGTNIDVKSSVHAKNDGGNQRVKVLAQRTTESDDPVQGAFHSALLCSSSGNDNDTLGTTRGLDEPIQVGRAEGCQQL